MKAPYGFKIYGGGHYTPSLTITIERPETPQESLRCREKRDRRKPKKKNGSI